MATIDWYFDFVSPFAYLANESLRRLPEHVTLNYRPVLFAGLLNHWESKGPAEIREKRRCTYRYIQWLAAIEGIDLRFPSAHPFNPLPLLRLSIALGNRPDVVQAIFRFVWRDGKLPQDIHAWRNLAVALDAPNADELIADPQVKAELLANGDRAIELGVFGVPTLVVNGELFWGYDALDFAIHFLNDPAVLEDPEMQRVSDLPAAAVRR